MAGVKDGSVIVNIIYWSLLWIQVQCGTVLQVRIYPKAQVEGAVIIL